MIKIQINILCTLDKIYVKKPHNTELPNTVEMLSNVRGHKGCVCDAVHCGMMHSGTNVSGQVNRKCPHRNTILQLSTPYTDPLTVPASCIIDVDANWRIN